MIGYDPMSSCLGFKFHYNVGFESVVRRVRSSECFPVDRLIRNAHIISESGFHDYKEAVRRHTDWLRDLKGNMSATSWEQYGDKLISHYDRAIHAMNDKIVSSLSRYDVHGMAIALIGLWTVNNSQYLHYCLLCY